MSNIVSLDAARYDAVFFVDTSEVFASLASETAHHQDFQRVLTFNAEWAGCGVLEVPTDKLVDVIFWIFHILSTHNKLSFLYSLLIIS